MNEGLNFSPEEYAAHVPNLNTRRTRLWAVREFTAWAESNDVDILGASTAEIVGYLDLLRKTKAKSTCVSIQRSLRAYYRWLEERGFIARSPLAYLKDERAPSQPTQHVPPEDVGQLLGACSSDRDWAVIAIIAFNSLRISELLGCNVPDFQSRDGVHTLHFRTSGQHRRRANVVVLADEVADKVRRQLEGRRSGPLFLSNTGTRLNRTSAARSIFSATAKRAGLVYKVTPDMVSNCLPVTALQRGFSYRGVARAMGVPDRRHSERWLGFAATGPADDNASMRLARLVLHPPDTSESMLMHVEAMLQESDLPIPLAVTAAGAIFERHLYELCIAHGLDVPTERKDGRINKYVHDLRRAGVFTLADQKLTEGIAEARNNAAHGAFDLLASSSGHEVLRNVRQLVTAHPTPIE